LREFVEIRGLLNIWRKADVAPIFKKMPKGLSGEL